MDVDAVYDLAPRLVALGRGANDRDFVAGAGQCRCFLPDATVERNGQVLHYDKNPSPGLGTLTS